MMQQFRNIKAQYPDAMLLFRCGDFYETYCEDAVRAAKILNITLTHRSSGTSSVASVDMAGFPYHALETYLPRLVRAGLRVAICDQLEDPKLTKKLVKRGVTELVTPGVSYSDTTLQNKENTFVAAVQMGQKSTGVAFLDISTGEFLVAEGKDDYVLKLLTNFAPKELLYERGRKQEFAERFPVRGFEAELEDWVFTSTSASDRLLRQFQTTSLKGFGVEHLTQGVIAAGAILYYLDNTKHALLGHIQCLSRIEEEKYVWLDRFTVRNLELFPNGQEDSVSLLSTLDKTLSPMGARLFRRWLAFPLKEVEPIQERQKGVNWFLLHTDSADALRALLSTIGDVERIISKVATRRILPRDFLQLLSALQSLQTIRQTLCESQEPALVALGERMQLCESARALVEHTIAPDCPSLLSKGGYIRAGANEELDALRSLQHDGKQWLLRLQQEQIEKTGIQSLKVGYNNVFGYYLEVRNTYKDLVPPEWIRKQTLAAAERYITPELKQYEDTILGAEEKIAILETQVYQDLMEQMSVYVPPILEDAHLLAKTDCLLSLASVAAQNHYVCPEVNESLKITITAGRHPVIEQHLAFGDQYVPNDIFLDNSSQQIIIITGPNMAGKSALLRQTALIVLMAQMGSFVPAQSAQIGLVDKIFTRVGASDNLALGESTFMVEMNEAASILNNLSERSLVLFDELGRGTSTYDGISIAWAIVEYIHQHKAHAKTLFATHYHELNAMEQSFERIRNYNVSVRESGNKVLFLRKLVRGGSEHSFGIHVARMAGMPPSVVKRAEKVLSTLEEAQKHGMSKPTEELNRNREGLQLSFFQLDDPVLEAVRDELKALDINSLTPLEALNKLSDIRQIVTGKSL